MQNSKAKLLVLIVLASFSNVGRGEDEGREHDRRSDSSQQNTYVERRWRGGDDPESSIRVSAKSRWTIRLRASEIPLVVTDKGNGRFAVVYRWKQQTLLREVESTKGHTLLGPSVLNEDVGAIAVGVLNERDRYVLAWKEGVEELTTPFSDDQAGYVFGFASPTCISVSPTEKWFAVGNKLGQLVVEMPTKYNDSKSTKIQAMPIEKLAWFPDEKKLMVLSIAEFAGKDRLEEELQRLMEADEQRSDKYKKYYGYYWSKMYRRKTSVYVWDIERDEKRKILDSDPESVNRNIATASIAVHPDGKIIYLTDSGGEVAFITYPRRSVVCIVQTAGGSYIEDLAVSPNGKLVGCAYRSGRIRILNALTGHILWDGTCKDAERLHSLCFTNDSSGLLAWGQTRDDSGPVGVVYAWDLVIKEN